MAYPRTEVRPDQPLSAKGTAGVAEIAPRTRRHEPDLRPAPRPMTAAPTTTARMSTARRLNILAALLIVAGGYIHLCLYRHGYRFIPKIGVSFLLQFTSSAIVAVALVVKWRSLRLGRRSVAPGQLIQLVRLSAIGLSAATLAALGLAHTPGGLFQFHEIGLRPAPQSLIAIIVESLAIFVLAIAMFGGRRVVTRREIPVPAASQGRETIRDAA